MFSCANITRAAAITYHEEKRDDYYHHNSKVPTRVLGHAAEKLGLTEYSSKVFSQALNGEFKAANIAATRAPDARRAAFDCTFSAPKSVSLEALVSNKLDVIEAHQKAVDAALKVMQEEMIYARVTENGITEHVKAEAVIFNFRHDTSRNVDSHLPDPQLHDHCLFMKQVLVTDEKTGEQKLYSLSNDEILKNQFLLDSVYKQTLATELKALGYALIQTINGFEIAGYTKEHLEQFSKRTAQIVEYASSHENLDHKEATLKTRSSKQRHLPRSVIQKAWSEQAKDFLPTIQRSSENAKSSYQSHIDNAQHCQQQLAASLSNRKPPAERRRSISPRSSEATAAADLHSLPELNLDADSRSGEMLLHANQTFRVDDKQSHPDATLLNSISPTASTGFTARAAIDHAIEHFSERESTLRNPSHLLSFAIKAAEYDVAYADIRNEYQTALKDGRLLLTENKQLVFCKALDEEIAVLDRYKSGLNTATALATQAQVDTAIQALQESIKQKIIADREAGQGRPLYINELLDINPTLTTGQRQMVEKICTGTDAVSIVVGDAGTGKSTSAECVLHIAKTAGFEVLGLAPSGTAVDSLSATGIKTTTTQRAFHDPRFFDQVSAKTLILIDEAGLLDTPTLNHLTSEAAARGARVALIGDDKQFGSVQRGRIFGQLTEVAEQQSALCRLDEMQRGRNDAMKELHFLSRDDPAAALDRLFETGKVTAYATQERRLQAVAELYMQIDQQDKKNALVLVGMNSERIAVNQAIRDKLNLPAGIKTATLETTDLTAQQVSMVAYYEPGDQIRINAKSSKFKKNELLEVVSKSPDNLVVKDKRGREHTIHPRQLGSSVSVGQLESIELSSGDLIRFTAADKDKGILNGDRAEVISTSEKQLTVKLIRTKAVVSIERDGSPLNLRYAYAQTGHSAQGATAKLIDQKVQKPNVILCLNSDDPTLDHKSFYTNLTRAADQVHIVTDANKASKIADLRQKISFRKSKTAALDLLNRKENDTELSKPKVQYISPASGKEAWQRLTIPTDASNTELLSLLKTAATQYGEQLYINADNKLKKQLAKLAAYNAVSVKFDDRNIERYKNAIVQKLKDAALTLPTSQAPAQSVSATPLPATFDPTPELTAPTDSTMQVSTETVSSAPLSTLKVAATQVSTSEIPRQSVSESPASTADVHNVVISNERNIMLNDIEITDASAAVSHSADISNTASLDTDTADIVISNGDSHSKAISKTADQLQSQDTTSEIHFIAAKESLGLPLTKEENDLSYAAWYKSCEVKNFAAAEKAGLVDDYYLKDREHADQLLKKATLAYQLATVNKSAEQIHPALVADKDKAGHFNNEAGKLALIVEKDKLRVRDKSSASLQAAMLHAAKNGWQSIEIKGGTAESKRSAWIEAAKAGLEVKGYQPTEYDKEVLAARLDVERKEIEKHKAIASNLFTNPNADTSQKAAGINAKANDDRKLQRLTYLAEKLDLPTAARREAQQTQSRDSSRGR